MSWICFLSACNNLVQVFPFYLQASGTSCQRLSVLSSHSPIFKHNSSWQFDREQPAFVCLLKVLPKGLRGLEIYIPPVAGFGNVIWHERISVFLLSCPWLIQLKYELYHRSGFLSYWPMFTTHRVLLDITPLFCLLLSILLLYYSMEFYMVLSSNPSQILNIGSVFTEPKLTPTTHSWPSPNPAKSFKQHPPLIRNFNALQGNFTEAEDSVNHVVSYIWALSTYHLLGFYLITECGPRGHAPLFLGPGRSCEGTKSVVTQHISV